MLSTCLLYLEYESLFLAKPFRSVLGRCASFWKACKQVGIYPYSIIGITGEVRHHIIVLKWYLIRCNGTDLGKVLAGIQVPEETAASFEEFLQKLDYGYVEETQNPVYQQFLRG